MRILATDMEDNTPVLFEVIEVVYDPVEEVLTGYTPDADCINIFEISSSLAQEYTRELLVKGWVDLSDYEAEIEIG